MSFAFISVDCDHADAFWEVGGLGWRPRLAFFRSLFFGDVSPKNINQLPFLHCFHVLFLVATSCVLNR